ncbi:DNA (cytosine-5)-methyltransferase CMT2 [Spatholobus suberectus]|nr:DNA (cytosine-5)-methyltransferase CMT2 [Spatholobus suberectus]
MLRCLTKLRCFAVQACQALPSPSSRRLLHHLPPQPLHSASTFRISHPSFIFSSWSLHASHPSPSFNLLCEITYSWFMCGTVSSRERKLRRKPMTPTTSKIKKTKMKSYSCVSSSLLVSYKSRFRTMNDGSIRRWKEGKRHNAHLKVQFFSFFDLMRSYDMC